MHDLLVGLLFVSMIVFPAFVASFSVGDEDEE
jgi:hypothetical protein